MKEILFQETEENNGKLVHLRYYDHKLKNSTTNVGLNDFAMNFSSSVIVSLFFFLFYVTFSLFVSRFQGERLGDDEQPFPNPGDMPVIRLF